MERKYCRLRERVKVLVALYSMGTFLVLFDFQSRLGRESAVELMEKGVASLCVL